LETGPLQVVSTPGAHEIDPLAIADARDRGFSGPAAVDLAPAMHYSPNMRTTVDLDREEALGTSTYREAIILALEEAVSRAELRVLIDDLEASDVTWGLTELLAYRRVERGDGR
jgi:hypothetical protein